MDNSSVFVSNVQCDGIGQGQLDIAIAVICSLCLVLGLFYSLWGYRCFKASLFFTGFMFGAILVYLICTVEKVLSTVINAAIASAAGLICGLIVMLIAHVGLFLSGFILGALLSIALFIVLQQFYQPSSFWFIVVILFCVGVFLAVLSLKWQKAFFIMASSWIGATLIFTGIDYFVERFLLIHYIFDILRVNERPRLICWYSWLIITWLPVIAILGIVIQIKLTGRHFDHRDSWTKIVQLRRKRRKANLERIRRQQHEELLPQDQPSRYRYLYQVRTRNGDVVSQEFMDSLQKKLANSGDSTKTTLTHLSSS